MVCGRSVDRNFFKANAKQRADILQRSHAAAVAQRHKALLRNLFQIRKIGTLVGARRVDIQKYQLVDFLIVKYFDSVDRIAHINRLTKLYRLYQFPVIQKETRNQSVMVHRRPHPFAKFLRISIPNL